jgi:hypothetical protein
MASSNDSEGAALNDVRRKKKNVEVYLSKAYEIETTM